MLYGDFFFTQSDKHQFSADDILEYFLLLIIIIFFFFRKQDLISHANCLPMSNCFLEKKPASFGIRQWKVTKLLYKHYTKNPDNNHGLSITYIYDMEEMEPIE